MEKGKQLIYVRLLKALYGNLKAALLFWGDPSDILQEWGSRLTHTTGVSQIR